MKIRFYLKKNDINKSGECPIRADINIRGTRLQKLIGYTYSADKWDDVKEQVKHGAINKEGKDYRVINSRITDIRTHFTTYDLTLDDKPTSEAMLKEFQKVMNKNAAKIAAISSKDSEEVIEKKVAAAEEKEPKVKVKPAVDYMDEFINEESRIKEWSMETRKMVKSLKNHLNKFKKNVGLDFYDQNGIDKFINYLRSTAGLEESSAEKVYKNLAWFLRWAIRKKYTQVRDIESYEPVFKTVKKPVIFLTQDELDKVFNLEKPDMLALTAGNTMLGGKSLGETLLAPTKIYVKPVLALLEEVDVKGISHITGGGFYENIPRSIPEGLGARIQKSAVKVLPIFDMIAEVGAISEHDMFNTFNMGVGMSIVVAPEDADRAIEILRANGEDAYIIGEIVESADKIEIV